MDVLRGLIFALIRRWWEGKQIPDHKAPPSAPAPGDAIVTALLGGDDERDDEGIVR